MIDHDDPYGEFTLDDSRIPPHEFKVRAANGRLLAIQVRTVDKRIWWKDAAGRPGLGGISINDLPLYRSERMRSVPLEVPVVLTEGPKDCDAVWRAKVPALGTMTGAGGLPSNTPLAVLRHRVVVLWPDNDLAGHRHMDRIADALIGVARELRWLDLLHLPPKAGAFDVPTEEIPVLIHTRARVTRARR